MILLSVFKVVLALILAEIVWRIIAAYLPVYEKLTLTTYRAIKSLFVSIVVTGLMLPDIPKNFIGLNFCLIFILVCLSERVESEF